jgi:hypothetical protein
MPAVTEDRSSPDQDGMESIHYILIILNIIYDSASIVEKYREIEDPIFLLLANGIGHSHLSTNRNH